MKAFLLTSGLLLAAVPLFAEPIDSEKPDYPRPDKQKKECCDKPEKPEKPDKPKFEVKPTGRILMDGGVYISPDKEYFKDGFAIPDARLGAKMKYGKWDAKIDIGFAYGKIGLKDLYINYTFDEKNSLKMGSFIHQFGLQSATSSSMKPTMEEPVSNAIFNDSRQLGLQYEYNGPQFLATASFHMEPSATTVVLRPDQFTQEGYGVRSRLVYRPFHDPGKMVQVGISGAFGTPQRHGEPDTHDAFTFGANFPSRLQQEKALDVTVTNARNMFKLSPELLLSYDRFALESQYFWVNVNRKDGLSAYNAQGAYVTLRGLILGNTYTYDMMGGGIATPAPKTLELVLDYNYTSMNDIKAGIVGGRLNDFSATLNYQINKYMTARLHYSYTHTWDGAALNTSLNAIMARLQVIF